MAYTYSITNEMVQNVYGLFISNTVMELKDIKCMKTNYQYLSF